MTIDIITAAQADRKAKIDQILALQLDVIEIDAFIAKARAYAGEGEEREERVLVVPDPKPLPDGGERLRGHAADYANADKVVTESGRVLKDKFAEESTTPEPSNAGASEVKSDDLSTTPSKPEIDPAPVPKPKTKKQVILDAHKAHPDWWAEKIADETGISLGTVRSYISGMSLNVPPKPYQSKETREFLAAGKAQEAVKEAPAPVAQPAPEPARAAPQEDGETLLKRAREFTQPSGTKFRLRNAEGLYLAADLNAMLKVGLRFVPKTNYPWQGTERQMAAVRKMLPETVNLREEVISNA